MGHQLVAPGRRMHRHSAEGGLQADEPAEAGGNANRAGAVGAERQRRQSRRDGGRSAASRSTRRAREIPRVARLPEQGIVGRAAPGELGEVGPAHEDRAGGPQPRDARGILGRDELRQQARAERGPLAGRPEVVLDRHGNAVERAERPAGHHRVLGRACVGQGPLGVDEDVGAQPRVQSLDALQHGAGDLDGRQRAATNQRGQLDGGGEAEIRRVHVSAPRCGARRRSARG